MAMHLFCLMTKIKSKAVHEYMKGIRVPSKHCHKLFLTKETSSTHYSVIHRIILYYLPAYHRTLCFWLQITLYCLPWWCIHKLPHKAYCLIFVLLYLDLFFQVRIHTIYIYIYMEDYIRLLSQQQSLSGGTSLITMYIPPNGRVSLSKRKLTNEMGLVSNIKSKVIQKQTRAALKSAL